MLHRKYIVDSASMIEMSGSMFQDFGTVSDIYWYEESMIFASLIVKCRVPPCCAVEVGFIKHKSVVKNKVIHNVSLKYMNVVMFSRVMS